MFDISNRVLSKNFSKIIVKLLASVICLLIFGISGSLKPVEAQQSGGLQVVPTRIVFEGRKRSAEVNLQNNGTKRETYRLSFKNMRMLESGDYEDVKEPRQDEKFADSLIRFSPRQVTLDPGEGQTIRLLVRKKKNLPKGEYRSHLFFRSLPPKNFGESLEDPSGGEKDEISIQLIPVYGVTIPVIVRHGKGSGSVRLTDLGLDQGGDDKKAIFSMQLNRIGNFSVFGDIEVTHLPAQGDEKVVGNIHGIAVFTPNQSRNLRVFLEPQKLEKGKLHIVYRQIPEQGGEILAEAEYSIP